MLGHRPPAELLDVRVVHVRDGAPPAHDHAAEAEGRGGCDSCEGRSQDGEQEERSRHGRGLLRFVFTFRCWELGAVADPC